MTMKRIGVVGSGTMGGAIAHQAAISGFEVILQDIEQRYLDNALARMEKFMDRAIAKGRMKSEEKSEVLARIHLTTNLADLSECNVVIEAIIEDLEAKKEVFHQLDEILSPEAIVASNTSSMSITVLAESTKRPEQVAGMHFFNPPQVMKLVEVIRGYKTSDETIEILKKLSIDMKKEPIEVKKDTPGFIVNRIMIPQFIEAIRLVEEGVATPEDIDKAVTLGLNYPMGPFTLQDYAGVDIGLHVMDYFYEEFKDQRFAAPLALRNLVRAGRVGKKSGAGWYDYDQ
ncbi:3-hydroxyacyl-CoA dehydrogenase family protein [Cytobacillus depressus]|uniref:3-hydroxyacyl-CoA dehydrogenase family protein n=1 Tax=Cytobacillus depressus TaxID=1602942 RepID=A0A6L3V0E6_9BACI|nr:3-hydroxyacyl-CoA dehydrogenase family protein [Cytobacillus depressus]KAB2330446.1 3-hydroxyacyl-CoA dehydrogenase family protein [Cytobacillus depressus]